MLEQWPQARHLTCERRWPPKSECTALVSCTRRGRLGATSRRHAFCIESSRQRRNSWASSWRPRRNCRPMVRTLRTSSFGRTVALLPPSSLLASRSSAQNAQKPTALHWRLWWADCR